MRLTPTPNVTLPSYWHVSEQDGTAPYPDEPAEVIPRGVYLLGRTAEDDHETTTVILRADLAIDDGSATQADVLLALAARLNAARADG